MKTGDLSKLFGVNEATIRNWTEQFSGFLSNSARKINTGQRMFDESDMLVMATVASLRNENVSLEDIQHRLEAGERVEHPGVANFGVDTRMVPAAAVEQIIDATELKTELAQVKAAYQQALEILDRERVQHGQAREKFENKIDALQEEIKKLQREIGQLEGELNYRRSLEEKGNSSSS